jgi:hypothetical protein
MADFEALPREIQKKLPGDGSSYLWIYHMTEGRNIYSYTVYTTYSWKICSLAPILRGTFGWPHPGLPVTWVLRPGDNESWEEKLHHMSKTRRRLARERKRCFSSSSEDDSRKR